MSARSRYKTSMLFNAAASAACFALLAGCAREKTPDDVSLKQPAVAMTAMSGRSNGGAPAQTADDGKQSRIILRPGSDAMKAARIMARTTNMAGLLVTNPELVPAADSMAALGYAVIVFHTLPSADDYCSRFTFSIYPPKPDLDSVSNAFRNGHRAQAVAFDAGASLDSTPRVALWSPALERFGALELNDRFRARWKTGMTSEAWASWVAVKILSEAALRKQSTEPFALLAYLSASEFDGHKGWPLTFRSADHVMRQPLYIVLAGRRDIVAELPSGGRSETEPAETVLDRVLPRRPNASCKGQ